MKRVLGTRLFLFLILIPGSLLSETDQKQPVSRPAHETKCIVLEVCDKNLKTTFRKIYYT